MKGIFLLSSASQGYEKDRTRVKKVATKENPIKYYVKKGFRMRIFKNWNRLAREVGELSWTKP